MIRLLPLVLLSAAHLAACQKTDCDAIKEHAQDCRNVESVPTGKNGGICEQFRTVKGKAGLAGYASCVTRLRCDDRVGLAQCIDDVTNDDAPACERLNGWLVACGLEPASGGLECTEYGGAENTPAFASYVQCVIDAGCLDEDDAVETLDECRNRFLGNAVTTLSACQRVEQRAQSCSEAQPTLATCALQVAPFTSASIDDWAACYIAASCGDVTTRANCASRLEIEQTETNKGTKLACNKVGLFQLRCNIRTLPVIGDPSTCEASLGPFSEESANDFGDCLAEVDDCMDATAILNCAGQLRTGN